MNDKRLDMLREVEAFVFRGQRAQKDVDDILEKEPQKPTTVHSRFHVGDEWTGFIDAFQTYEDAREFAESGITRKQIDPATATIYDVMARRGQKQTWCWIGKGQWRFERRPAKENK